MEDVLLRSRASALWHEIHPRYRAEDEAVVAAMLAHRGKPQSFWGVQHASAARWAHSIRLLERVEATLLPSSKLYLVQECMSAIFAEMHRAPGDAAADGADGGSAGTHQKVRVRTRNFVLLLSLTRAPTQRPRPRAGEPGGNWFCCTMSHRGSACCVPCCCCRGC